MNNTSFNKYLIIAIFLVFLTSTNAFAKITPATSADERPWVGITTDDINRWKGGDLCPLDKKLKYHHHLVLIDSTTPLKGIQIELIERYLLGEIELKRMPPYDRLTIVRLRETAPAFNKPVFSMCRPRNGDPNSMYKLDKASVWTETQMELEILFSRFTKGIDDVFANINIEFRASTDPAVLRRSPILEQIFEISRIPDFEFDKNSGYQSRTLTIVSDLTQNTERIPFYTDCNKGENKNCPRYEDYKKKTKIKLYITNSLPDFGDNIDVKVFYLNTNENRGINDLNLDRGILEWWKGFFQDAGIDDFTYNTETDN